MITGIAKKVMIKARTALSMIFCIKGFKTGYKNIKKYCYTGNSPLPGTLGPTKIGLFFGFSLQIAVQYAGL
jgi:hypothetical protein